MHRTKIFSIAAIILAFFFTFVQPVNTIHANHTNCGPIKVVGELESQAQLVQKGYHFEFFGPTGSNSLNFLSENGKDYGAFRLHSTPTTEYTSARIQDYVNADDRCWDTNIGTIVATWTIRYPQPSSPSMTENMLFWNVPFNNPQGNTNATAFGMTRSVFSDFEYAAVATVNLDSATFQSDLLQVVPASSVAPWLDPTEWHNVITIITSNTVTISVQQGLNFATLIHTSLPQNWQTKLGLEFSTDNEFVPGVTIPPQETGFDLRMIAVINLPF